MNEREIRQLVERLNEMVRTVAGVVKGAGLGRDYQEYQSARWLWTALSEAIRVVERAGAGGGEALERGQGDEGCFFEGDGA